MAASFVFFYEMVSQVRSQEEKGEAKKTKFVVLPGPRARRRGPTGPRGRAPRWSGGRRQGGWSLGHDLHWGFRGEDRQGRANGSGPARVDVLGDSKLRGVQSEELLPGRLGSGSISLHTKGTPSLGPLSPLSLS